MVSLSLRRGVVATAIVTTTVLAGGTTAFACESQPLPIAGATAVRAADGSYQLSWVAANGVRSASVYAATHPIDKAQDGKLVAKDATGAVTVTGLAPTSRWYFTIVPGPSKLGEGVAAKLVNLEGVNNARDLGGYPAADGLRIRWGTIFRSARLTPATTTGREEIAGLGVKEDVDFRSTAEATGEGADPIPAGVTHVAEPVGDPDQAVPPDPKTPPSTGDLIMDNYRLLVSNPNLGHQFFDALTHIADARQRPVLYHCTGGNHRTGWMTVILLKVLGVPDDVIRQDYLLSSGTTAAYLDAAYDQVTLDYGSFPNYLVALGVTDQLTRQLRHALLEAPR
ncbi:protein-tyrosine phosphatase [Amycolatopsis pretoriensis]|uniref:Protein-tyrosine phosphatase n=1 Tax=Amycolatopsis pretoriensis TaxID=218821 RepID=A0A1H5QE61_9PSEU|nr:tyrosine-protein phosphatase [Amycolatopsis pretoriensis]SEF24390.1 protein-tyrosine phosphatase [Amycolatopsis pretoriensis]